MSEISATPMTPQAEASDPRVSAWVSANAGSGKTTVLVRRVIRLLLEGVPPGRILCLTYTKAAAAHMANKVLKELSAWVRLDDEALDRAIATIESRMPDAERRTRARRLFASALETPGGLKVQTIHAFCDRVLHMFPVEAEAPAGFEVLDEAGERDLIEKARTETLLEAGRNPESAAGRALRYCVEASGDETIEQAITECLRAKRRLQHTTPDRISTALGLLPGETLASIEREIFEGPHLPRSEWLAVSRALIGFGGFAKRVGERIERAIHAEPREVSAYYLSAFFKSDGDPREPKDYGNEKLRNSNSALFNRLFAEGVRAIGLRNKLRSAYERERSCALLTLAQGVIERYEKAKQRRGVLDFADLVTKTVALLEREESAWVHYKLDGGIEHILVDEAQDTSPEQWRIVAKLAEEFFAGRGASEWSRSIFVVGDEKQSIFSFQGADPTRFDEMRRAFAGRIRDAGEVLREPRLRLSYRSAPNVLNAVDRVFSFEEARRGLSANETQGPLHEAVRQKAPGTVEIWPLLKAVKETEDEDGWDKPLDRPRQASAKMRLAQQIARAVKHWTTDRGLSVADRNNGERPRPVTPGDIIILVQSRGTLFDAILRALKQEDVEVAGADRLKLTENIAVMDLMALGDALLLSQDDLSLACVLKSPLFNFDDDDLFTLCHTRKGTLLESLATTQGKPAYAAASLRLRRWQEQAAHLRPFDFYSRVLGRDGGRKRMIARLGPEAADALDEFLSAALAYEKMETPSLQGFLRHLRRAEAEVKRDLETESPLVRVMTVHGVKGLEAPVVVLADTTALPHPTKEPRVVPLRAETDDEPVLLWTGSKEESSSVSRAAKAQVREARLEEYRRLLYVALTRAADVLVVCGALNKNQDTAEEGSWYDLVKKSILADSDHVTNHAVPYAKDAVFRWRATELPQMPAATGVSKEPPQTAPWLTEVAQLLPRGSVKLRPSYARTPAGPAAPVARNDFGGRRRGILLHRLLQSLPDLVAEERNAAALRYLAQAASDLTPSAQEALAQEACRVIAHPDCAVLFGQASRAEPELIARLGADHATIEIAARADRLAVLDGAVVIGDFKSDARVPETLADVPGAYIEQLAAYRAALLEAFPGRPVRALLVYTAGPRALEIPAESLDSAWARVKSQTSPAIDEATS